MSTPILTLANQVTMLRMGLAPLLVVLVLDGRMGWALGVFVLAGISDVIDGLIARIGHQRTTFGEMLDPMADKVLLSSAFVVLTWGSGLTYSIPSWLTVTTLSRDAIILLSVTVVNMTVGRRVFLPSLLGKLCTTAQLLTAGLVLLFHVCPRGTAVLPYLFVLTLLLTVASGFHYVYLASARPPKRPVPPEGQ